MFTLILMVTNDQKKRHQGMILTERTSRTLTSINTIQFSLFRHLGHNQTERQASVSPLNPLYMVTLPMTFGN